MDLKSRVSELPYIGPFYAKKFEKLGIKTLEDLFYHIPARYMDYSKVSKISSLKAGQTVTIHAEIVSLKTIYSKKGLVMQIGSVKDDSGKLQVLWFNQPYLIRTLYPGKLVSLSGKVNFYNRRLCLNSPDFEMLENLDSLTLHTGRLVPVYPETAGISSKVIRRTIYNAYKFLDKDKVDPLPIGLLSKYKLKNLTDALNLVHFPKNINEAEKGRERLAFDEFLRLELVSEIRKKGWKKLHTSFGLQAANTKPFIQSLPFELTKSQKEVIKVIENDLKSDHPMNRLLEGDVGSGKTVVAGAAAYAVMKSGYKTVVMAPTQILAQQHYDTFSKLFPKNSITLITSASKNLGEADIYVGTHALIHRKLDTNKVGLVVIDEQHKFGVEQREHLVKMGKSPHVLTMTATPIPRTVAMAIYGDLDLSVLKDMPKGRLKVITWVIPNQKRAPAFEWIRKQIITLKSQAFVVCPLIENSTYETMKDIKSVTEEYENLKHNLKNTKIALLHGRLKTSEKDKILNDFRKHKIDVLVTTPIVEVGIDIPDATIMVIETAERFGLAQLHQLRGRVGRSDKKSYCLLFGPKTRRLTAMEKTHSGFELAELDLKIRGPGEIFGTEQSGFPSLKAASWDNFELISKAKEASKEIVKNPKKYSTLMSWMKVTN